MDKKILLQNLADSLAAETGLTKRKAEAFIRSFFDTTESALLDDGIVKIKNFGTIKIVAVNNRESVNINTGERFQIEGHDKITFTPDAFLRDLVNRPFAHFTTIPLEDDLDENELNAIDSPAEPVEEEEENLETLETAPETIETAEAPQAPETAPETLDPAEAPEPAETPEEEKEVDTEEPADPTTFLTPQSSETMQQPIIIQNTIPSDGRHNWWRTAFIVLITLVLMALSYLAGYFRILCPCEFQTTTTTTAVATPKAQQQKQKHAPKNDA